MEATNEDLLQAADQDGTEMKGKYLTFLIDYQFFGIPIADVVQIVGMQEISQIPEYPSYAKGIINLRGSIIPVIDVRLRFGKAERPYDERTCIIVTMIHSLTIGFIVDEVDAVTDIDDDVISPPPVMSGGHSNAFLTGIGKLENRVVLLLDTQSLLTEEATALMQTGIA